MKRIDRLVITSFIPPFIVAFCIAIFVLVMQTLWLYIDDIAGKGLGLLLLVELLAYKSVSLIPLALPLGILISSVMVIGGLAEHYELSSIKSAGVPLLRTMRSLLVFGVFAAAFSYYCSATLIPVSNLKFGSRMWDIQRQKPALRLDEGIFNDDFEGYTIHIGNKKADGRHIEEVLIYDQSEAGQGRLVQISAEKGEMYASADGQFFVMELYNGHQYMESRPGAGNNKSYPFVRSNFSKWTKVFDLGEFNLKRTNEELFKQNRSMLGIHELKIVADSLAVTIREKEQGMAESFANYFHPMLNPDTSAVIIPEPISEPNPVPSGQLRASVSVSPRNPAGGEAPVAPRPENYVPQSPVMRQIVDRPWSDYTSIAATFEEKERAGLIGRAKSFARSMQGQSEGTLRVLDGLSENRVKHIYDLHTKYSMAVVCLIFMLIGAPMGAIVRKGGFGVPILVSILFFIVFVVLTIFCRKIAESLIIPAALAAWVPGIVLFPIGVLLTKKAMNDSRFDGFANFFKWVGALFSQKK
jgi:lipopolysaccharide export system permease protein